MNSLLNEMRRMLDISIQELSKSTGISMVDVSEIFYNVENSKAEEIKDIIIFLSQKFTKCGFKNIQN